MGKYRKYDKEDQVALAIWAAECAERVLPIFERDFPDDPRPRRAIDGCRTWIQTRVFRMNEIRATSLGAHAAARAAHAQGRDAACFAARAAGHAIATAHVAQHAFGAALYALKATAACAPNVTPEALKEWLNDSTHLLPVHLSAVVTKHFVIERNRKRIVIKLDKANGF